MNSTNEYFFHCTGGFDIDISNKFSRGYDHDVIRFHLPDGREVDLFVGLRVTNPDGTEEYLHKSEDFEALGFHNQAYEEAEFIPSDAENEIFEEEHDNKKYVWVRGTVQEFLQLTDEEMASIEQKIKEDKEKGAI